MTLSQFKQHLNQVSQLHFILPNGLHVPLHVHITEAGLTTKHFVDCGGTVHIKKTISFQLWYANDFDHRLNPQTVKKIIDIAEPLFAKEDLELDIEFQTETINRYGLDFNGHAFLLRPLQADCLAKAHCGIPQEKQNIKLLQLQSAKDSCCLPNSGCC